MRISRDFRDDPAYSILSFGGVAVAVCLITAFTKPGLSPLGRALWIAAGVASFAIFFGLYRIYLKHHQGRRRGPKRRKGHAP